ncbi:type II toxin-antitoxin system VapC family toxin [Taklimakanibacter deserti]|uniref:type II toxin-antitoxin system VapC family toxin n=1 Tax=Taklimakanibacter deserti TaxID=2267839 RepID=UPI000E64B983
MILPDVNVLLYVVNSSSDQHAVALRALRQGFDDPRGVAFAWTALLAFLRLATRRGIFPRPLSIEDALHVIERWLGHPQAQVIHPGDRHAEILGRLLKSAGTAGNLTTDAHLAALAIEHGAAVLSFDRDFARFDGVQWTLPSAD